MSNDNGAMNGQAQAVITPQQASVIVNNQMALPAQIFVRGIIASAVGVPADVLLTAIARQIAIQLAQAIIGNPLEAAARARGDFKKAFEDGLSKVPIVQSAGQIPPGMPIKPHG